MAITHLDRVTSTVPLFSYGRVGAHRNSCSARNQIMFVDPLTSHIPTTSEFKIMTLQMCFDTYTHKHVYTKIQLLE
jgi:hypothetical protein